MSRSLYFVLAPFVLITAIVLPLCIPNWTIPTTITMVVFELFLLGLLIGLWDIERFEWAVRGVAAIIFLAYVVYVIHELAYGPLISARRSQPSVWTALAGLMVWGLPSFYVMTRGVTNRKYESMILFATTNPHKIEEVQQILAPLDIDIIGLDAFDAVPDEPVEDGDTFQANARIKAVYYAQQLGCTCIADDSGLEVDALGGAPGVHSARFASDEIDSFFNLPRAERDAANNRKLLRLLQDVPKPQRTARFVCAMCLADPDGGVRAESRGTFEGVITDQPRGDNGFGYDPLLYLLDVNSTSAELSPADKNARSHRGDAARKMAEHLRSTSLSTP